jgi:hypothetical protein
MCLVSREHSRAQGAQNTCSHGALFQNAAVPLRGWWCWLCEIFVCEHGHRRRDGADDPEDADQIFEHVLQDEIMDENDDDGERTGEGKSPGSPGGDEMQPTQHEADQHRAHQVANDVDQQVDRHDGIAVEVPPECGELCSAADLVDIIGQGIQAHERGPGDPADQGERRRDGGEPGCAPHAQQGHAQVAQGQEEGGGDSADEVQRVAGWTGHRTGDERRERRALIALPGDEVERDRERREEDAGRKAHALEGESSAGFHLLRICEWEFHLGGPFLVLTPFSLFYNLFSECTT